MRHPSVVRVASAALLASAIGVIACSSSSTGAAGASDAAVVTCPGFEGRIVRPSDMPHGACSSDAPRGCDVLVLNCDCPGYTAPDDDYRCDCTHGQWACTRTSQGSALCDYPTCRFSHADAASDGADGDGGDDAPSDGAAPDAAAD